MALRLRHRVAFLLAASIGLSLVYTASAMAATQWVNDDQPVGGNTSCADPGFMDIQSAVDAANPLDTVRVCPGVYAGGVQITKRLTVRGAKFGQDARFRGTANESIVSGGSPTWGFALMADRITVDGFTFRNITTGSGVWLAAANSGHIVQNNIIQGNSLGIYANSSAGFQNIIRTNLIRNNNSAGSGVDGTGIYGDGGMNRMLITRNAIRNQQNVGINLASTPTTENRNVTIQFTQSLNNRTFIAMFGNNTNIQIRQNQSNDTVPGDDASQASAIFMTDNAVGIVVANNVIRNSPFSGVAVREQGSILGAKPTNVDVQFNQILNPDGSGVDVTDTAPGAVSVFRNTIRSAGVDGIFFDLGTSENFINTNNAKFSADFDCHDLSTGTGTASTGNDWTNNIGPVADPPGICRNS